MDELVFYLLRVGRVSVAIRKLVHYSWYGPAGERPSWAGTNWKGSAGQGSAIIGRDRYSAERDFLCVYVFARPQVEQIVISSASITISCTPVCCAQQTSPGG